MLVDYAFNRFEVIRSVIVNSSVLFAIVTTFILHRKGYFVAAVLWIGFIIMGAMFYQSIMAEAITTSSMAVVMVVGFGFSVLLRGNLPIVLHFITLLGMTIVFGWLSLHPASYNEPNASDIIVAGITYGVLYTVIAYSSRLLKQRYDAVFLMLSEKNQELVEKTHEIATQNEELHQSQENLNQLNNHLEQIVHERTNEVKKQNDRLIRYAYANAHHLRGPVARLLGLIQLSRMETDLNYPYYFNKIEEQALEIDQVVRNINRELE
jgi:signal transduction histidine kinase